MELPQPIRGLNKVSRLSAQPPETSRDLLNVRPLDATTGRVRMSPRSGLSSYMAGYLNGQGSKVQALAGIAYQARHLNYSADTVPDELWATTFASGATASVVAPGLYDDLWTIENNKTLRRQNRYGVLLGSIDVPVVSTTHVLGAVEVASDGGVFVATSDYVTTANQSQTRLWRYDVDTDGETISLSWTMQTPPGNTGRFIARMREYQGSLYTIENDPSQDAAPGDNAPMVQLCQYTGINTIDGPASNDRTVLKNLNYKTFKDINGTTFPLVTTNAGATLYAHDMALQTNSSLEFVVACGTPRDSSAGSWGIIKVKRDLSVSSAYCLTNDETTATALDSIGGGVGLACDVGATGNVFSLGRRNANDNVWLRMMTDTGTAWSTAAGWVRTTDVDLGLAAHNPTWGQPRMDVDKFGNLFAPTAYDAVGVASAVIVKGTGALFTSIQPRYYVTGVPTATSNECRAVTFATTYPDYKDDDYKIADTVYVAGSKITTGTLTSGSGETPSLNGYDILLESATTVSSRAIARVGVAGGDLRVFTTLGSNQPVNLTARIPPMNSTARFIQHAEMFGKLYFTDGSNYTVYDPEITTTTTPPRPYGKITDWTATGLGVIPPRCRLITAWRGRMVLAHAADSPFFCGMSALGDPQDWDLAPPEPVATQAVDLALTEIGQVPDIINAMVSYSDDLLFLLCDHSIWRISGDPMAGGQLHQVSKTIGGAFGTPWCRDPEGRIYFFGSKGGVYVMSTVGDIVWLTQDTIEADLSDLNLSANRVELVWNSRDNGLHVFVMPYGAGGTHLRHYWWSADTKGWFPDEFGTALNTTIQPTAATVIDGDLPNDRVLIIGTEDGRIVQWDPDARSDAGLPIDARLLIGPIAGSSGETEFKFSRPRVVLARELGGAMVKLFASDTPETPTTPNQSFPVSAGVNETLPVRARGSYVWAQVRSATRVDTGTPSHQERWALESINVNVSPGGRKRARAQ